MSSQVRPDGERTIVGMPLNCVRSVVGCGGKHADRSRGYQKDFHRGASAMRRRGCRRLLVALLAVRVLLLSAKHLFYAAKAGCGGRGLQLRKRIA